MTVQAKNQSPLLLACLGLAFVLPLLASRAQMPTGWTKAGDQPEDYEMIVDTAVQHGGKASARIRSITDKTQGFGTMMQTTKADAYRGKRIRLSAFIETEDIQGKPEDNWAGLWMRIDGPDGILAFDNMQDRALWGSQAWKTHSVVLDVSDKATTVNFGVLLAGRGSLWIDDVRLEIVGNDVPVTDQSGKEPTDPAAEGERRKYLDTIGWGRIDEIIKLRNLDFSAPIASLPDGWYAAPPVLEDYSVGVEADPADPKRSTATIESKSESSGLGVFLQVVSAYLYLNERVRFAGNVKTEKVENWCGLWMRVDGRNEWGRPKSLRFYNMQDQEIRGSRDWTRHAVVLDVPTEAEAIVFGVVIDGPGSMSVRDLTFEQVGEDVEVTGFPRSGKEQQISDSPSNLDFEK
jgi:hypothetical protein